MTLPEPIMVGDGFRLVTGPLSEFRRDRGVARTWCGLSAMDAALLERWLARLSELELELYTDVACGVCVELDVDCEPEWLCKQAATVSALRIDAVVCCGGAWTLIELKPDAGYVAMGQMLTYAYYAGLRASQLVDARMLVVTDRLQDVCRPVYRRYGVEVAEVGEVDAWS